MSETLLRNVLRTKNTLDEGRMLDSIRTNLKREDVGDFIRRPRHKRTLVIVCGGPSMKHAIDAIRRRAKKADIVCVNHVHDYLINRSIIPKACLMMDPGDWMADMITPRKRVKYFIASQCDPSVFDKLKGHDVVMWHADTGIANAPILQQSERPWLLVTGGCTAGLRWLNVGYLIGYRVFHYYGLDSSMDEGGLKHAYRQAADDGHQKKDKRIQVNVRNASGEEKSFCTTPDMASQAQNFVDLMEKYSQMAKHRKMDPIDVKVHGSGLIPFLAKPSRDKAKRD